ncbi:MAG: UvrB/UvrC motif-containing protein [Devosia sp.]|nr:UvrB/UvrC motif-containing protein [Devosia sp.]
MSLIAIERKIAALEQQMRQAAEAEDFEAAARLRNEIAELKGLEAPQLARKPPPGQMGLGTHLPVVAPPKGWKRPNKPDPMTSRTTKGRIPSKE